ncbi:MAG: SAM-dependent methyltransferase, partial [Chloroflexota bacterium]
MSGRPELVRRIQLEIERAGPMTFDRFMERALYEPGLGYYASLSNAETGGPGALADFQTSPQAHPAFGFCVARYLRRVWDALGQPRRFVIVEPGAGAGELARQIRDGLAEEGASPRVEYHAVDARSGALGEGVLGEGAPRWWRSLDDLRQAGVRAHAVVSNEFFDALPVHRVVWLDGRLRESYVDWGEWG